MKELSWVIRLPKSGASYSTSLLVLAMGTKSRLQSIEEMEDLGQRRGRFSPTLDGVILIPTLRISY